MQAFAVTFDHFAAAEREVIDEIAGFGDGTFIAGEQNANGACWHGGAWL
jgi:hypothetical protein